MHPSLSAPFPWFGGKRRIAPLIWQRFGTCRTYIEPFAGPMATLLARPSPQGNEIVNDLDCYVANFWRALQRDPEAVAWLADYPVNEADLVARLPKIGRARSFFGFLNFFRSTRCFSSLIEPH